MIGSGAVRLGIKISKFEEMPDGTMLVTGSASSEDLDAQGEIVDFEGTRRAALEWEGNVREQHNPLLAVGRRVDSYFDEDSNRWYVKSLISSGSRDTQAKIREGVLRYYSVGGDILDGGRKTVRVDQATAARYGLAAEMLGQEISILSGWKMNELSLVDVGANPASEVSIVKRIDGKLVFANKAAGDSGAVAVPAPAGEVAPEMIPEAEPENPADDEMAMREHLIAARQHLEAAAILEVGEVGENGTYCLEQVVAMMAVLQRLEETKLMNAAMEATMASKAAGSAVGVAKGVISYKMDKDEVGAVTGMMDQLGKLQDSMKAFLDEHGEKAEAEGEKPEAEGDDEADVVDDGSEEKAAACGSEEKAADPAAPPDSAGAMVPKKRKEAAASGSGSVEKAVGAMVSRVEKALGEVNARLAKIEAMPVSGGPVRFAPVEKGLAHGLSPAAVEAADVNISKAFEEAAQSGQPVTESAIRWALAKQSMGAQ